MSQLEILNLARSCRQTIDSDFAQVITITFAMVVAIYYFLHQAGVRMKIFASAWHRIIPCVPDSYATSRDVGQNGSGLVFPCEAPRTFPPLL